jgi:hypothetical protein
VEYALLCQSQNRNHPVYGAASKNGSVPYAIVEALMKWAASQRKRRSAPKGKLARKCAALDKQIRILEKRLSYWRADSTPPRNPVLEIGEPYDNLPESRRAEEGALWNWERRRWLEAYQEKPIRRKVGRLAMQKWARWQDLIDALTTIGVAFPKKPKLKGQAVCLREIDSPAKLVAVCNLSPSCRREGEEYEDREWYVRRRSEWLESKRTRAALVQRLTDLRELRTMPEKLAQSDIGLPEGVTVEA